MELSFPEGNNGLVLEILFSYSADFAIFGNDIIEKIDDICQDFYLFSR
jgi:hypothetical protein